MSSLRIAVIIPARNEASCIAAAIASARDADACVVADGGSGDVTIRLAEEAGAEVQSIPNGGYAMQANAAAATMAADVFLFLAADSVLGVGWRPALERALARSEVVAGGFRLRIADRHPFFRVAELGGNFRAWRYRLALADQGLFVRAAVFQELGGFSASSTIPHADLCFRLRNRGAFRLTTPATSTSSRKWRQHGFFSTSLRHVAAYRAFLAEPRAL